MKLHLRKLTPAIGVEISGINLNDPLSDSAWREIEAAFNAHGVLVFPNQEINDETQMRFAARFGELMTFGPIPDGTPSRIFRSTNLDEAGKMRAPDADEIKLLKLNWLWHTDSCYQPVPSKGVVLRSIEMVADGGDTIFANNAAAYKALPASTRARIDPLVVRHSLEFLVRHQDVPPLSEQEMAGMPRADHPLVRVHPDGVRSLFLSPPYMETVLGWEEAASATLFEELVAWASRDEFTYHHPWAPGDVVVWNNLWTMHRVSPFDVTRGKRVMHGATILGTAG